MVGCSGAKKESTDDLQKLKDEVIELHDEVMPLMDPLYDVRSKLQKQDSASVQVKNTIKEIKAAEEAMMQWMRDYEPDYQGASEEQTRDYFQKEKDKIKNVAEEMKSSLEKGRELLKADS